MSVPGTPHPLSEHQVKRAINHVDRELAQLDSIRRKLAADLADKTEAIDVDTKVLNIQPDGDAGEAAMLKKKSDYVLKTPHTWATSTEDNVKTARHWIADSTRCLGERGGLRNPSEPCDVLLLHSVTPPKLDSPAAGCARLFALRWPTPERPSTPCPVTLTLR